MLLDFPRLTKPLQITLITIALATCVFLLLPIVFIVALSFGSSQWLVFPPPSWTLNWYQELFNDSTWLDAAWQSLKVALWVTLFSVLLGYVTALTLARGRFKRKEVLRAFFLTPMVLPVVVLAVALYAVFLKLGLNGSMFAFVLSHLIIAFPFAFIAIANSFATYDFALEDAARVCGANEWQIQTQVTMPAVRLGIVSAAVFSFLISWDEVVLSIFMSAPGVETLPVKIWSALRQDLSPVIAAASAILIGVTVFIMILIAFLKNKMSQNSLQQN
jgi:putative spermidine/putrescine transport system permease protein